MYHTLKNSVTTLIIIKPKESQIITYFSQTVNCQEAAKVSKLQASNINVNLDWHKVTGYICKEKWKCPFSTCCSTTTGPILIAVFNKHVGVARNDVGSPSGLAICTPAHFPVFTQTRNVQCSAPSQRLLCGCHGFAHIRYVHDSVLERRRLVPMTYLLR